MQDSKISGRLARFVARSWCILQDFSTWVGCNLGNSGVQLWGKGKLPTQSLEAFTELSGVRSWELLHFIVVSIWLFWCFRHGFAVRRIPGWEFYTEVDRGETTTTLSLACWINYYCTCACGPTCTYGRGRSSAPNNPLSILDSPLLNAVELLDTFAAFWEKFQVVRTISLSPNDCCFGSME